MKLNNSLGYNGGSKRTQFKKLVITPRVPRVIDVEALKKSLDDSKAVKPKPIKPQVEGLSKGYVQGTKGVQTPKPIPFLKSYSNEDMDLLIQKFNRAYIGKELNDIDFIELYQVLPSITLLTPYQSSDNEFLNQILYFLGQKLELHQISTVEINYLKDGVENLMREIYQKQYKPKPLKDKVSGFSKGYNNKAEIKRYGR